MNGHDARLMAALSRGSTMALTEVYRTYKDDLLTCAYHLLGDRGRAEDVLQDVFVTLAKKAGSVRINSHLRGYLVTSCLNRARDLMRRKPREPVPVESLDDRRSALAGPDAIAMANDEAARVSAALATLPREQREVVVSKIYGQLTFKEIAESLSLSINTAMSRHRYALDALRKRLVPEGATT
ncbi:MAG: sigma-70 family RNA polymerase sigma factor [Planctomycetota bacterium]